MSMRESIQYSVFSSQRVRAAFVLLSFGLAFAAIDSSLWAQDATESLPPPSAETGTPAPTVGAQASPATPYNQRYEAPLELKAASWTYIPPPPVRTLKLQDIVTIRVDELARMQAEGSSESRKNSLYDALLKDWIGLKNGNLRPDRQANGDPRVQGSMNSLYRADSGIESRESLSFNIAARIVDIRPNGNLVLEAHKTIFVNENTWETFLSGACRADDVGPDNVILSRDLIDLQIRKNDRGRMRDGYRRGWFTRWFETLQPF